MTPAMRRKKKALADQIAALDKERPKPIPVAEIVTDGDYRFTPDGDGRRGRSAVRSAESGRGPTGSFLHTGPGRYEAPPSYFLIRGDPEHQGLGDEAGVRHRGDLRQSADRDSARPTATRRDAGGRSPNGWRRRRIR